jgi:hypothetical protein
MSKRLYSQFSTLVLLSLSLGIIFLAAGVGFSADTYSIPQTAEVTLAWDPNDPAPDGYRIFQRIGRSVLRLQRSLAGQVPAPRVRYTTWN